MTTEKEPIPLFARSSLGGKRSAKCESRITDELKFALDRRAHDLGMTVSDYIERLLSVNLFGEAHVLSVEAARTRGVIGLSADALTGDQQ